MASLYQKWRPQRFSEVAGQEHIKKTLLNALKGERLTHAYLFTGPRGTGKTTMARLLAKSLNCEMGRKDKRDKNWDGEPCNKCDSCREITSGQSLDVIEIDAASNRGIDEIRELREKIKFAPGKSAYKVFIIDEVHMLTREAFNALLKTLEEPPSHAVFILATTEPHKLPATITSRCQRYDFKRAKIEEVRDQLKLITAKEKFKIAPEALDLLGRLADGSWRDGLSLLDQITSTTKGEEEISLAEVQEILGVTDLRAVWEFFNLMAEGRVQEILGRLQNVVESGTDMTYLINRLIEGTRQLLLVKSGVDKNGLSGGWTEEEWGMWIKLGDKFSPEELLDGLRNFIEAAKEIKSSPLPQLPIEMAFLHWFNRWRKKDHQEVEIDSDPIVQDQPVKMVDLKRVSEDNTATAVDAVGPAEEKNIGERRMIADELWQKILEGVKPLNHSLFALLKDAQPLGLEEGRVVLGVRARFQAERLYDKKNRPIVEAVLTDVLGSPQRVECEINDKMPKPQQVTDDELLQSVVEVFGAE